MALEVTWIHHWKKKGNNNTLTRPFRVRAVQGLSGLALLNVDPEKIKKTTTSSKLRQKNGYIPYLLYKAEVCRLRLKSCCYLKKKNDTMGQIIKQIIKTMAESVETSKKRINDQKRDYCPKKKLSSSAAKQKELVKLFPFREHQAIILPNSILQVCSDFGFFWGEKIKWNLKINEEINVQGNRLLKRKLSF